jgi:ribonuclease BN (tRNA processing enzyme)
MRLRVLGCSGGIGGRHLRTTSFLLDSDVLIDAGTGVGDLTLAELSQIDHIFVTHSHLDHVTSIPFLVDTVGGMRSRPLTVYSTAATIEILKNHLFNWAIWPDFTEIPTPEAPFLRYQEIDVGTPLRLGARPITPIPARHTVPVLGRRQRGTACGRQRSGSSLRPPWTLRIMARHARSRVDRSLRRRRLAGLVETHLFRACTAHA